MHNAPSMSKTQKIHCKNPYFLSLFIVIYLYEYFVFVSVPPVSREFSMQGLCDREVLEGSALQCYSHCSEWCRYEQDCPSPLLHWHQAVLVFPRFVFKFKFLYKSYILLGFAEQIVSISQDDSLFASYFWWREFYHAKPCDHGIACHTSSYTDVRKYIVNSIMTSYWPRLTASSAPSSTSSLLRLRWRLM